MKRTLKYTKTPGETMGNRISISINTELSTLILHFGSAAPLVGVANKQCLTSPRRRNTPVWAARPGGSGVLHIRGDVIHWFGPLARAGAVYYISAEM